MTRLLQFVAAAGRVPRAGVAAALVALATPAAAQQSATVLDVDGRPALDLDEVRARGGFQLFASGDGAMMGLRMTGTYASQVSNYGPCSNVLFSCQIDRIIASRGVNNAPYFHLDWAAGAPPSEWAKIRRVAPEAANARGGGYTAGFNGDLIGRPIRFGPADNTLGQLFAGMTATTDGTCRDHSASLLPPFPLVPSGVPLLAGSDCPDTWPTSGWRGDRTTPAESYQQLLATQGSGFQFDFWRVPDDLKRSGQFMGSNQSTYGETSDFNADILEGFGGAVPGGSGTPAISGYPLGLVVRWEAFNFAVPSLSNVWYLRATLINRSEDVWGAPVDYDSLYFGVAPGTLLGTQNISNYYLPDRGMVLYHSSNAVGAGGPCDDAARAPSGTGACLTNTSASRGYNNGASAVIVLKSPIGDLRNKLFTRLPDGSPCTVGTDAFCDPTHPAAGDTITFNHGHFGGFGSADAYTWDRSARASFGFISSTEVNTLDGRNISDATAGESWGTFRNAGFPAVQGAYNKYVPGAGGPGAVWDWNGDGQADTLYLDTCGPNGCVGISSDTMPGGQINRFGNVGGIISAGPFALAGGDSTSWFMAFAGDGDSVRAWTTFDAAMELYTSFFLSPEAPPPANIASVQTTAATNQFGTAAPSVTLFLSDDPERWVDPFIAKLADDFENAPAGTPSEQLVTLNPTLVADLRARAADNVERLEIYKSCDGGTTFTNDADCIGDPAADEDGNAAGLGWQAYAILEPDASGDIPNVFTDPNVQGGRTLLYVIVARTRGAEFILSTPGGGAEEFEFAPVIRNTLSRSSSDPNVASVYIPASNPAGFTPATASVSASGPPATVPLNLTFSDNVVPGAYRAVFGNRLVVQRDSSASAGRALGTTVHVERVVTADVGGTPVDTVIRRVVFRRTDAEPVPVAGLGAAAAPVTNGDTVSVVTTFDALGFVLAREGAPVFGSITLTGADATPTAAFASGAFPGFTVAVDNSVAGTFNTETALRGAATLARQQLLPSDTVVPRTLVDPFMVQWQQNQSTRLDAGGVYELTWAADPYGTVSGFDLNRSNPTATGQEVTASLRGRPAAATGRTDADAARLLGVPQTELVAVRLPFTVRNVTHGRDVEVAMTRRLNSRILLGSGVDTARISVPEDEWIPGDQLALIETVTRDSATAAGVVLDGSGQPMQVVDTVVSFQPAVLGCTSVRTSCNPLRQSTPGATGYGPLAEGDRLRFDYFVGVDAAAAFDIDIVGPVTGDAITAVTDSSLSLIRVVPNPFVIFSQYQTSVANSQILFTNLPPRGVLRIYTVAGQFVQQVSWTPEDLQGTGDLFYDLKSREGIDIATGLYFWVVTAPRDPTEPASEPIRARGKFVVIRGSSR